MSVLLHLYPRRWRVRYEAELRDLLAARPFSWRERLDLARGALDAQLHPELVPETGGAPVPAGPEHGHSLPSAAPFVSTPFLSVLAAGLFVVASVSLVFRSGIILYSLAPANTLLAVGSIALAAVIWRISSRSLISRLGALILAFGLLSIVPSHVVLPVVIPMAVGSLVVAAGSLLDRTMPPRLALLMGVGGFLIYWGYLTAISTWFVIVPICYAALALAIGGATAARSVRLLPSLLAVSLLSGSSLLYAGATSPIVAHDGYQLLCTEVDQHECVAQADRAAAHQRAMQPGSAILLIQVGPGDIRELCWRSPTDAMCESGSFN
jgi:hypothetical protein